MTILRRGKRILDSLSLVIAQGEHAAIIGPNGSGKSTLIKAIVRDYYPLAETEEPAIKVFGQEIWDVSELRSFLGIVSNDLQQSCAQGLTGRDVILSGFFSSIGLFSNHHVTRTMEAKAQEILAFLEVPHLADRDMAEMSSGEARRILIGRALVHDPRALILDEPTNSLDMHAAHAFRGILRKIARSGKSVILVTHHLQDIIPEMQRVILLKDGKIFKDGPKEIMLTNENLSQVFGIPVDVYRKDEYYYAW
jgi:iron complex transport system ATP-binding protein